jgi:hypothetical protein
VITVPADVRSAFLGVAVFAFVLAAFMFAIAMSGAGAHRAPRKPPPTRTLPRSRTPGRRDISLLSGELPKAAEQPTQPYRFDDTMEMDE